MNENLKRHRPDIKVLGEGKAIAFMPEDPMGVWCHIQEVRDLLDVKDRTIRDYEDNYLPRPKNMELRSWMIGSPETGEQRVYDTEEVDRVIAMKDQIIETQHKRLEEFENGALFNREDPAPFNEFAKICGFPLDSLENYQKEITDMKAKVAAYEAENTDLKKKLADALHAAVSEKGKYEKALRLLVEHDLIKDCPYKVAVKNLVKEKI